MRADFHDGPEHSTLQSEAGYDVLELRRVHPFGNRPDCKRKAEFGSEKDRSDFIAHWLDPRKPFGKHLTRGALFPRSRTRPEPDACTLPVWTQTSSSPLRSLPHMISATRLPTIFNGHSAMLIATLF
jgi:hypothetical protein